MRPVPIAIAVAIALATGWRWKHFGWPLRAASAAACVAAALYGAGVFHLPDLESSIGQIGSTLGAYTYALVAVMAFLETGAFVGLLVPGETVVVVGGVVAGQGHVHVLVLVGVTWLAALLGDLTSFLLGRRLGRGFLLVHGPRVHITEPRLARVEDFFSRYGMATILIGRFVGLVRPIAPFLAGASRYPSGRFLAVAVVGTGLWSAAFVLLGYVFWQSFDEAIAIAQRGTLGLAIVVAVVVGAIAGYRYLRSRTRSGAHQGLSGHSARRVDDHQHENDRDAEHDQPEQQVLEPWQPAPGAPPTGRFASPGGPHRSSSAPARARSGQS
jgi:membrane protein DedA with SNARE-associated domain